MAEVKPHEYVPDYMLAGDCRICGHVQGATHHAVTRTVSVNDFTFKTQMPRPPEFQPKPDTTAHDAAVAEKVAEVKSKMMADIEARILEQFQGGELKTPADVRRAVQDAYLSSIIEAKVDENDPTLVHFTIQLPKESA